MGGLIGAGPDERALQGCRVLVVEDEYMLADELCTKLSAAGAVVLGPVGTVVDALDAIASLHIDLAILDVDLRGEKVFPVADVLTQRNVPFVFTTGYDASAIPSRFEQVVRCEKPTNLNRIAFAVERSVLAIVDQATSGR